MISIRSILLILLIWSLLWLAQRWYKKIKQKQNTSIQPQRKTEPSTMVRCDHCGLYLPEQEALHSGKARYCCEAHKQADRQP